MKPNFEMIRFTDEMMHIAEDYLRSNKGFLRVTVPRIVPVSGACENVDTLFEISVASDYNWFKSKRAYFAQTGQLYLESLLYAYSYLYCIGPSARAETIVDTRHLTEFEMIEIEFAGDFRDLLTEIEGFISNLVYELRYPQVLENYLPTFPKIKYKDAIQELKLEWGKDISSEQEKILIANHGNRPIFIIYYPNPMSERMQKLFEDDVPNLAIKFFNMLPYPDDPDYVLSADCIVPYGGKCVGAAARITDADEFQKRLCNSPMLSRLKEKDANAEQGFEWYIKMMRKYPPPPHVGCGFGMSRIFQYLLSEPDITKVVVIPSNKGMLH